MFRTSIFPSRYIQGAGALRVLDDELARLGTCAACLVDENVAAVLASVQTNAERVKRVTRSVNAACTMRTIAEAAAWVGTCKADVVVAFGGGKVIDVGRAVADDLRLPFVCVPTIAASDAPCSALSVIYDQDGHVVQDRFMRRNPDLVLVDSEVIVKAPVRFFVAGIGDALATWYEARACYQSQAGNLSRGTATLLAMEAARLCRDTLFRHAVQAVDDCRADLATPDFEATLESTVLLSGIGFESGGVAAAHAIHNGLTELHTTHPFLHGEKVAIGVLASLFLTTVPDKERSMLFHFCRDVGLPTRLSDIGVDAGDVAALKKVAERACREGEIMHNEPRSIMPVMVVNALQAMDRFAVRVKVGTSIN